MENNQTKKCTKCETNKSLDNFSNKKDTIDGLSYECRACRKLGKEIYHKTIDGVITAIYGSQKGKSKLRGHKPPLYSKKQLSDWLRNDWLFLLLYRNWCNCNYNKNLKPSCDRLDDTKGYSFTNIQIITWAENNSKHHIDCKFGKNNSANPHKHVIQLTNKGNFLIDFISIREAERTTLIDRASITRCCQNKQKTAGGFKWKFKAI